jgi:Fur family peroxide stress response transcriptional regulator
MNEMIDMLKRSGLRVTPQRRAMCRALAGDTSHPTAQAIYERLKPEFLSLSLATVYNTLQILVEAGIIHEIGAAGDGAMHYDADPSPHVNLICTNCGRIDDFHETTLKRVTQRVARHSGYQLRGARVAYYGLCPDCRRRLKS